MASGKPDWNRAVTIQGKYDSNWMPVLVDATGQMYIALTGQQIQVNNLPSDYFKSGDDVAIPTGVGVTNLPSDYFKSGENVAVPDGVGVTNLPTDYYKATENIAGIDSNITVDQSDSDRVLKGTEGANKRYVAVDTSGILLARLKGAYSGSLYDIAVDASGIILARLKGTYDSSLYDVAVDVNGNLVCRMKGADSGTLRDIYVDSSGKMVTRMQGVAGGVELMRVLDDGGDTSVITDWANYNDGAIPVDNTDLIKEGSHSCELGIDADKAGQDNAYWIKSTNMGDCSAYEHDWIYIWVYFDTIDYLLASGTALAFYIGNDSSNFLYFYFTKANLSQGWNLLECDLDNPSGTQGSPDFSAIDWQRFTIYEVASNTNDFKMILDTIMIIRPNENEGSLSDILTDKDGMLQAKMCSYYAGILRPIAIDQNGIMKANLSVQDLDRLVVRTSHGACASSYDSDSYDAGSTTTISLSGQGILLGGFVGVLGVASRSGSYVTLTIDGTALQTLSFTYLNSWGLNNMYAAPVYSLKFDDTNFYYCVGLPYGYTFESSVTVKIYLLEGSATVTSLLLYATV